MQHRARQPARTNGAIHFPTMAHQVEERGRSRRPIRIDVADEIRARRQLQALDQRASLSNGSGKNQCPNLRVVRRPGERAMIRF